MKLKNAQRRKKQSSMSNKNKTQSPNFLQAEGFLQEQKTREPPGTTEGKRSGGCPIAYPIT